MIRLSGSSLARALACPGSLHLPIARTASKDADEGTGRHAEQENAINRGDRSKLPADLDALIPDGAVLKAEVACAYDVATDTARELGCGIGREYGKLGPFEIPFTIDLLGINSFNEPNFCMVVDHKGHEEVERPSRNPQILLAGLGQQRFRGASEVLAVVSYLPTGEVVHDVLDALDLDAFAERLRALYRTVAEQAGKRPPDVSEGKHCKYCPSAHACPAKISLINQLARGDGLAMEPLTVETAAIAWERLKMAKQLMRCVENAVIAFARDTPVPLGGGQMLGLHEKVGNERLDGDVVWQVLAEKFGRELADAAVAREATKKRLEEALKAGGVTPVAGQRKAVLDEVARRGGSERKRTIDVIEYQAEES